MRILIADDNKQILSVLKAYAERSGYGKQTLLILFNFSDKEAVIAPELDGKIIMLLNTDWESFGGSTKRSMRRVVPDTVPAFSGMVFSLQ